MVEIRSNASPKNRCWYCVIDDFNGLTVDEIIAVFSDSWIVCIPFLEIDVYVAVTYRLWGGVIVDVIDVIVVVRRRRRRRRRGRRHSSLPFWKHEFFWLDDDFRYFSESGFIDDGF